MTTETFRTENANFYPGSCIVRWVIYMILLGIPTYFCATTVLDPFWSLLVTWCIGSTPTGFINQARLPKHLILSQALREKHDEGGADVAAVAFCPLWFVLSKVGGRATNGWARFLARREAEILYWLDRRQWQHAIKGLPADHQRRLLTASDLGFELWQQLVHLDPEDPNLESAYLEIEKQLVLAIEYEKELVADAEDYRERVKGLSTQEVRKALRREAETEARSRVLAETRAKLADLQLELECVKQAREDLSEKDPPTLNINNQQ